MFLRLLVGWVFCLVMCAQAQRGYTTLKGCTFVATDWADGDSFRVRSAAGEEMTLRLYGVDCIEMKITDDNDARRLLAQQRYFGIQQAGREVALGFAGEAKKSTVAALAKPFTVHTTYADARGSAGHKRVYAFVVTQEGVDLSRQLLRQGLARAFGVYRSSPEGISRDDLQKEFDDLELQALRQGKGVWAKTDWVKLPDERRQQRVEDAVLNEIKGKGQLTKKINVNTAARDELMKLKGVGEVIANRIISGRPYRSVLDLKQVEGIGAKTFQQIERFVETK